MKLSRPIVALALLAGLQTATALAQSTQATSPGQSGASNTLPQAPSGGAVGGMSGGAAAGGATPNGSAAGQPTKAERQADKQAQKATQICKGC
ncbi:hypothetical protein [Lichenifustis flavocetrariae]|uniref:Uncharacterized protein n=1 Tax=Lichenifustis flavocetrariae TaxID=2949735 RepID=A0AA41YZC8_9HYPH|nr:hypothetical protein [Lichenifustis flavocetrariae]MCW6506477.1 hypothetical protein [Lichenifustis flavocetrariae]